jgi:hypothetical protein
MRTDWIFIAALAAATAGPKTAPARAGSFTDDFSIERCTFVPSGRQNPYFSLNPGDQLVLAGEDDSERIDLQITVKDQTRTIRFDTPAGRTLTIEARVVEEREWIDGELVEVSRNYFSRCRQTNDVFYFGEAVDIYEDGEIVSHDGAWEAGSGGAQPGIIIPARFLLGARYFQELAPGVALDRAKHLEQGFSVSVAGRTFDDCVMVVETTPLEPGHESFKVYCPDVGLVIDDAAILVDFRRD